MANVDTPVSERQFLSEADPARIYEKNAEVLYAVLRYFLPEAAAAEALEKIAADLINLVPDSRYKRYSNLVCLRSLHDFLASDTRVKVPRSLNPTKPSALGVTEALCLLLRDKLTLSCFDIAAVIGVSEGSVRTKLERSRAGLFPSDAPALAQRPPRPVRTGEQHICIKTRELIEDWNVEGARLGRFSVPQSTATAVDGCARCELVLRQRLASLAHFQEFDLTTIPEKFRAFPVSPLFLKNGRRMFFNWSAAPWYVRALFEGLLATTLVLGIVLSIPRVKALYEFWLERKLDLYSIAELASNAGSHHEPQADPSTGPAPQPVQSPTPPSSESATSKTASKPERLAVRPETEFGGREETPSSDKIYRILIKTDSPETVKEQVLRLLTGIKYVAADQDAPAGADLPGGVMFDVFVPLKAYKPLMNDLAKIGEMRPIITRAKERGMPGKARFKIWLQRI